MLPDAISCCRLPRSACLRCRALSAASSRAALLSCANRALVSSISDRSEMARTDVRIGASSGWLLLTAGWCRGYGGGSVTSRDTSRWWMLGVLGDDTDPISECRKPDSGCGVVAWSPLPFSDGYSLDGSRRLLLGIELGVSTHWSASRASLGAPMYLDSRLVRSRHPAASPLESNTHHQHANHPHKSPS